MYCGNCGNVIADDARFCVHCGATVAPAAPVQPVQPEQYVQQVQPEQYVQPVQQVQPAPVYVQPKPENPMFKNFLSRIKGFFSSQITKELGAAAKSQTMEWILFAVLSVLSFAFAMTIGMRSMVGSLIRSLLGTVMESAGGLGAMMGGVAGQASNFMVNLLLNFGLTLLVSIVVAGFTYVAVSMITWLIVSMMYKKNVTIPAVLNMVGYASIPLTIISLLNILVGLIWAPLALILYIVAVIMSVVLLYVGIQKLDKFEVTPYFGFALVVLATVVVAALVGGILYSIVLNVGADKLTEMSGSITDMFDMF